MSSLKTLEIPYFSSEVSIMTLLNPILHLFFNSEKERARENERGREVESSGTEERERRRENDEKTEEATGETEGERRMDADTSTKMLT